MNKLQRYVLIKCLTLLSIFIFALPSFAINGRTTYQAKIVKPDGHPLEASSVNFRFSVLDQTGSCVLYVEDYSAINMTDTGGLISFPLGSGTRAFPTSGTSQTFQNTFDNAITSFACQSVGIYNPNPTDTRKIVMQFNDGGGWQTLPAMSLNAVPYAMFATRSENSRALNGKADTSFVEYSSIPTCTASQALQYTGSSFVCVTSSGGGSVTSSTVAAALGYSPVDPASVTALTSSLSATDVTVASVSSSVYSVSSTVSGLSNSVTSLTNSVAASFAAMTSSQWTNSTSGIYYSGGNVAIGTVSSTDEFLVYKNQDSGSRLRIRNPSSGTAAFAQISADSDAATAYIFAFGSSYTTNGRFVAGSGLYDANGVGGLGISASNPLGEIRFYTNGHSEKMRVTTAGHFGIGTSNPVTRLEVSGGVRISMESAACAASYAGTLRYNAGNVEFCNGTAWSPFGVAGAGVTSAAVISALGYTPLNSSVSGSYLVKSNDLSDLTSATVARNNLGLGSLATLNYLDLNSAAASGTLAIARLPAMTGDATSTAGSNVLTLSSVGAGVTSGSQYTKVTVDGKGRVTSGSQLSASDIGTALGYNPANSSIYSGNVAATTFTDVEMNTKLGYSASTTNLYSQYQAYKADGYNANITEITGQHISSLIFNTYDHTGFGDNGVFFAKIPFGGNFKASGTVTMAIKNNSTVGIGILSPKARLHLAAGTSTIAPLKFSSSTLITSPQSGTMEYDGFNFYLTDGANQRRVISLGSSSGTIDNASAINSSGNIALNPATGSVIVSSTTNSNSTSTGALVVNGGAGIAGNLNVGGTISGSSLVKATGYRANQGAPDAADSSTVGYAFGLDGDTGLFSPGAGAANGVLAFYNNNVETVRIASDTVGIGTSTPIKALQVVSGSMIGTTNGFPAAYATVHNEFNSGFLKKWTETSGNQVNVGTYSLVAPTTNSTKSNHSLVNILFTDVPAGTSATGTNNSFYNFAVRNRYTGNTDRGYVNSIVGIRNEYGHQNDVPGNSPSTGQFFGAIYSPQVLSGSVGSIYDIYLSSLAGGGTVGQYYSIYQESTVAKNYFGGLTGFGTTAPQRLVHVSGTGANGILLDNGTTDGTNLVFHDSTQVVSGVTWNMDSTNGALRIFTEPITAVSPALTTTTGTERMIIKPNGNVGINNVNPAVRLDVRGPTGDPSNFVSGTISVNNGGVAALLLGTDDTVSGTEYAWIQSHGSRPLYINKGGNNTILNSAGAGKVGIGTTTPGSLFTVKGTRYGTITPSNAISQVGGNDVFLYTGAGDGIGNPYPIMLQAMRDSDSQPFGIALNPNGGKVGIGTLAPEGSLHIVTSGTQTNSPSEGIFMGKSLGNDYQIQLTQAGGTPHIDFSRGGNADYDARISNPVNNAMWLGTASSSALMALSGLNVGIGTVTPQQKLEVSGTMRLPYLDLRGDNGTVSDRPYIRGVNDHLVIAPAQNRTAGADANSVYLAYPGDLAAGDSVQTRIQESLFITSTGNTGNGNVVIGSSAAPSNKFEVHGGDTFMEGRAYVYSNSGWGAVTPAISLAIGDNDTGLNWVSDGVLQIYANNAPRMHFAVTGATGIGRTDPTYSLDVAGTFRVTGQAYTDTGAATFTVLSDVRYKDVHGAYERGLDDLLKIGTIRYNYKKENPTGADPTHEYVGVAAQNVQEAIPEAVEKQTAKDGKEFLTVNPSPIIFAMINGFRDMYAKIVSLIDTDARHDREIASLKAENEELKTKVKEFDELKQYICSKDPQAPNCK